MEMNKSFDFAHLKNQLSLARNEINNLRHQLKTLSHIHRQECDEIYEKLNKVKCQGCENSTSNGDINQPSTSKETKFSSVNIRYIGLIHTQFPSKRGTPRQPSICSDAVGKLVLNNEVFTNPQHALEGLEQFSHMWIIFHFHQTESTHVPAKVAPPRLNGLRMGVFGTRSPHRPSPLGLSLVKINQIVGNVIYFSGVDMVNGTPVVDIKPFIPQYDTPTHIGFLPNEDLYQNMERDDRSLSGDGQTTEGEIQQLENVSISEIHGRNIRTLEGEENERSNVVPGAIDTEANSYFTFETLRSNSRIGEREAPDGEEEGTDPVSIPANIFDYSQLLQSVDEVRVPVQVPGWLENPIVPTLTVQFKMPAEIQLRQLGADGEERKNIIKNVLSEDPRSVYLRERQGDSPYVFRIADLYVTCSFNDGDHIVYVLQVVKSNSGEPYEETSS